MNEFILKTKIYMGEYSCKKMQELPIKKPFIICDPFIVESGKIALVTKLFDEKQVPYGVFSKVIPDPTVTVVGEAIKELKEFMPDTIIAYGGGSALDTAKAVGYIYTQMENCAKIPLMAIPTTSGTGSEVTSFAVISDPATESKIPLVSDEMIPDVAFLDPALTLTVPPSITADTGIDVFTHAIEAWVSTRAQDFSDANALHAMRILWKNLEQTVKHGDDIQARMHMHHASCLAGIAFNAAGLGICHSMAHALGARFHISHGRSNGMLLPHVMRYNANFEAPNNVTLKRYAEVAAMLGVGGFGEQSQASMLVSQITKMKQKIGIPLTVQELGIDPPEFLAAIPEMAAKAMADQCTQSNPRVPKVEDLEAIYRELLGETRLR